MFLQLRLHSITITFVVTSEAAQTVWNTPQDVNSMETHTEFSGESILICVHYILATNITHKIMF